MRHQEQKKISPERTTVYYVGMAMSILGVLLFFSVFVSGALAFSGRSGDISSCPIRAVIGMGMMIAGGFLTKIGAQGLAGSGIVLDPDKTREDLEPWNRMAGGMVNDVISEVDVVKKLEDHLETPPPEVKVRCRNCRALNDETAKFCNQCGSQL